MSVTLATACICCAGIFSAELVKRMNVVHDEQNAVHLWWSHGWDGGLHTNLVHSGVV